MAGQQTKNWNKHISKRQNFHSTSLCELITCQESENGCMCVCVCVTGQIIQTCLRPSLWTTWEPCSKERLLGMEADSPERRWEVWERMIQRCGRILWQKKRGHMCQTEDKFKPTHASTPHEHIQPRGNILLKIVLQVKTTFHWQPICHEFENSPGQACL